MTVQNDQRKTYEAPKAEVLLDKRASQGKKQKQAVAPMSAAL